MANLKSLTLNGVKWYLLGDGSNIIANFLIGLILARLLTPYDYGTVGVYSIFFALANIFINGGFSMSLIHKREISNVDCSTAFWSNVIAGAIIYLSFYFTAPLIAELFDLPILIDIIRVSAIGLLIGSFTVVQNTLFNKRVDFRTTAVIRLISNITAGLLCIYLAYQGFGAWSLVLQGLTGGFITTLLLWKYSNWRPSLIFSWDSFRELFSFGGKILGTRLLECVSGQSTSFVLGKNFSPSDLGFYEKGASYARLVSTSLSTALFGVSFPVLTKVEDQGVLIVLYRKYLKVTSMAIFFLMLLLFSLGRPIIIILYTSRWEFSSVLMQIVIWALMFNHIIGINNSIFNVKGRSDILMKLQFYKTIIQVSLLVIAIPFGIYTVCFAEVIYYQFALILCGHETKKIIGYGYIDQMKDIMPYLLLSIISVIPAFVFSLSSLPNIAIIICGGSVSLFLYLLLLYIKKDPIFIQYIWNNSKIQRLRKWMCQ